MKRTLLALLAASLLVVVVAGSAFAMVGSITNTKHDLSVGSDATTRSSDEDEICVFCHTPHNARVNVPLWNRQEPAGTTYTTYSSATLDGARDTLTATSSNVSMLCLSCHDGTISLGAIVNNYPAGSLARGANPTMQGNVRTDAPIGALLPTAPTMLGTDLSNDHPIAITYVDDITGADLRSASGGKVSYTPAGGSEIVCPLYDDKVECASCHAVHGGTGAEPFLRGSNTGSNLCLTCHLK